jgi:hypothetical protein
MSDINDPTEEQQKAYNSHVIRTILSNHHLKYDHVVPLEIPSVISLTAQQAIMPAAVRVPTPWTAFWADATRGAVVYTTRSVGIAPGAVQEPTIETATDRQVRPEEPAPPSPLPPVQLRTRLTVPIRY